MQLAIDSTSDEPGAAIAVDGVCGVTLTWRTERNHSVELLPNIERLLADAGHAKDDIEAVFVDLGPGGYAALRVGVSIAKALAHGLHVPIAGVGRLELDSYGVAPAAGTGRIIGVHHSGRRELAWAVYQHDGDTWREVLAPRMVKADALEHELRAGDAITGDIDDALSAAAQRAGATPRQPRHHRVVALAALGNQRLVDGRADDPRSLVPLYLRAPAIGPQSAP